MNSKKNLKPFIDIIVPNYNKGLFIRKCIKSIVHQSYKNWFLYIIDDASNDDSTKFLKDFSGLTNINIIILKKNVIAYKYNKQLAYYRILKSSRSTNKVKSIFSLWKINKKFNKMSFFENIKSIFFISLNSLKKYGLK